MTFKTPQELLPHEKPMIFISAVEAVNVDEGTLLARINISQNDIMYQSSIDGVPSYAAIEYMAQTIGCFVGYYDLAHGRKPGVGFVLGTRKLKVFKSFFKRNESYFIDIKALFHDQQMASFDCQITDKDGNEFANSILNAYRPDDIEHFMKEYT